MTTDYSTYFPEGLEDLLSQVGKAVERGRISSGPLDQALHALGSLPPHMIVKAGPFVRQAANLSYRWPEPSRRWWQFPQRRSEQELLDHHRELAFLFLFHSNGYLREAALAKIDGPLESAFWFTAIARCTNDAVEEVRFAAEACAQRTFPKTDAATIVEAALFLCDNAPNWGRRRAEPSILERTLTRLDIEAALAELVLTTRDSRCVPLLRYLLRYAVVDKYLHRWFRSASLPWVRAVSLKTLLTGEATWQTGLERHWIDKSMGVYRMLPGVGRRPVEHGHSRAALISQGFEDRSATVRRVALDGLIRSRDQLPALTAMVRKALHDRNRAVRDRAEYLARQLSPEMLSDDQPKAL